MASITELEGKTITSITGAVKDSDSIVFKTADGLEYAMYHDQDCCESVALEDVCGDIDDLIGSPVLKAYESSTQTLDADALPMLFEAAPEIYVAAVAEVLSGVRRDSDDSNIWTFYRLSTIKGTVVLRWHGTSNGYYSERVDFKLTSIPSIQYD